MNDKKIKMSTVYGECLKLSNKYYDTDSALNYAVMHGGFTTKKMTNKKCIAEKRFLNQLYARGVKMNSDEIIEMLEMLLVSVATISSEDEKTTILDDIKPSSFEFVIKSAINILEGVDDEIHK